MEGKSVLSVVLRFNLSGATTDDKNFRAGWTALGRVIVGTGIGMVIVGLLLLALRYGNSDLT